ncbi:Na+/H+ antiporter subunit B [Sphingobacterium alkalisoli]|uniref:Na+/H+ antiporter subunit B n=2 Tax=Sphingobacterium TaxID=28453 RepID=A0A4U0P0M2_9SPHI|nr:MULTISPECIES: Na+/H+ antiporter subunit B [Sphingobacterium]TJY64286.1 Na+/H+ antiporter subunit B [Sphingobacterium alkalisoli]TJZ60695.1 Na+/H+ antiporter subunit B [Sphingobacterium olei]GGH22691.1 Na(+)/H(+) antiporter subunit B [Sphingobacterium alkalisoli]
MRSPILQSATKYLLPILLLFSFFLLLRGHYYPGGGFVGGLVASIAFVLHSFANGTEATMKILRRKPLSLIPIGLGVSTVSMTAPMLFGLPPMTGLWFEEPIPVIGMIGSSLFFDLGVYLVVIGVILTILFTISLNNLTEKD